VINQPILIIFSVRRKLTPESYKLTHTWRTSCCCTTFPSVRKWFL